MAYDGIQRTAVKRKDRGVRPFDRDFRPCVDVLNDYMRVMMSHIIPQINQKQNNRYMYIALKKYHQLNRREIRRDILCPEHQKTVRLNPRPSTLTGLRYNSNPDLGYFQCRPERFWQLKRPETVWKISSLKFYLFLIWLALIL